MRLAKILSMVLMVLLAGTAAGACEVVPPPRLAYLAKIWVGGEPGGGVFLGLRLAADGTGAMAIQYLPQQPAKAYKIAKTTLDGYNVLLEVVPAEADAEAIYLRGTAISARMELEIGGTTLDWKRSILLEPREKVIQRLAAVDTRLGALHQAR